MESDNRQQEQRLWVRPLGFDAALEEKLKTLFKMGRQSARVYALASPDAGGRVDILLVNYDNPVALQSKERLLAGSGASAPQIVAVSHGPLEHPPSHHLRGIITAARLLNILDSVELPVPARPEPASVALVPKPVTVAPAPAAPVPASAALAPKPISAAPVPVSTTPAPEPVASVTSRGYRVLVVDDSLAIQKSLEIKLVALAQVAVVDCADSGESALVKAATGQYDLIFLDVMMPGIDGYETCVQLRKMPGYKKIPIIMVSGKTSPMDEVKGVMAGCTTYLTKPVQDEAFQKLSQRVLTWLANRDRLNEEAACKA